MLARRAGHSQEMTGRIRHGLRCSLLIRPFFVGTAGKMQPERFYHGFVLGMLVELRDRYEVKSNRESGYGRYDVMLIPLSENDDAIILEFKVHDPSEEKNLEETVQAALAQIEKKKYDTELTEKGFPKNRIRRYGFAFEGKRVLIGGK